MKRENSLRIRDKLTRAELKAEKAAQKLRDTEKKPADKIKRDIRSRSSSERIGIVKNIIIAVLVVVIIGESIALAVGGGKKEPSALEQLKIVLNLDAKALVSEAAGTISNTVSTAINGLADKTLPKIDIPAAVREIIYSDSIVNMAMSIAYPLLNRVLVELKMMEFSEAAGLYPTPKQLASQLKGNNYTCCDKKGVRKNLKDILKQAGDWKYFDTEIETVDKNGKSVKTSLWNTIRWGVNGKDSFYNVLGDMTCGLKGALEVTLQGKRRNVNINLIEFLLKNDFANVNLDAAAIYNGTGKSGYETCIIPLFSMLGLTANEYPSVSVFCGYTKNSDIMAAILEPVMTAVHKAVKAPVEVLPSVLLNFVDAIESGTLIKNMKTLRMDAEYHKLASTFMGFQNGLLFNLGDSLTDIINEMGIKISGNFNQLIDSLMQLILHDTSVKLPDMDIQALMACGTPGKDAFGNKIYNADSEKVIDYLINYIIQEQTFNVVLKQTDFFSPEEAAKIIGVVTQSREGLLNIVNTVLDIVLAKIQTPAAEQ